MSINANYVATPRSACALVNTLNAGRDGLGTVQTVFTAPAAGSRIDDVSIQAIGTTTSGMIRLFLHNGTSNFLIKEVSVTAITPSGTVKAFSTVLTNLGLVLANGHSLRASTEKGESFHVCVTRGGDF